MARKKTEFNKAHIDKLLQLVQQSFGRPLTYSFECEQLSQAIEKATGALVSPNTLRRLFGFLQTPFSSSVRTLNVLAVYAGYTDWQSFSLRADAADYIPMNADSESQLYLDFYQIQPRAEADMNFHNAARNIAFRILFNPSLLKRLAPMLAKNPVAQVYFYERFPYIDALCTEYSRSIQLYLQKKTKDAQIFGYSLLFLGSFLCGDHKEMKTYYDRLCDQKIDKAMHPFVIARFLGTHILYAREKHQPVDHWLKEVKGWNQYFMSHDHHSFWYYPFFQHMMGDYLNLAGLHEEAYVLMHTIKQYKRPFEIEAGYEEALQLIEQLSKHKKDSVSFKKWMQKTTVFDSMSPLFRKYFHLQACCTYISLLKKGKERNRVQDHVALLISQTHFYVFRKALEPNH